MRPRWKCPLSDIHLGLMTVKGTRHLLCSVVAVGPEIWICWPEKMTPQPYRLALTVEEAEALRTRLAVVLSGAREARRLNRLERRRAERL